MSMTPSSQLKLLVTGGAGYIGSHMCVELINSGHEVVVLDNLSNGNQGAVNAISHLTNYPAPLVVGDIRDERALNSLFEEHDFDGVVHFAGLKAVGESVQNPLVYYDNNVAGTLNLLRSMAAHDVQTLVFSSSATVYGDPASVPIDENFPTAATNPYGQSKLMIENVLRDFSASRPSFRLSILRYFNPVGAHSSGAMGEDPKGMPNNLMPFVAQVATGRREQLDIFGGDYPTRDGTGVRDYIHVVDLARGHLAAIAYLRENTGLHIHNLGTGRGYSVLEIVRAFEKASGREIPFEIVDRRPGDIAECYADPTKAREELGWEAKLDLTRMCADVWRWHSRHPEGFAEGASDSE